MTALAAPSGERVLALDALRGLAVIGIVPMNVIAFAMPPAAYINPRAYGGDGVLETALWALSFLFIEDKFRALFAMMFGAGVAILLAKAAAHPLRGHYARMAVLLAIALAHATLLANNDVLRSYAVAGLLLPLVIGWQVRTLLAAAGALVLGQLLVSGWFAWDWLAYWYERASGAVVDPAAQVAAEAAYGYDPQAIAAAVERNAAGLGERVLRRLGEGPQQLRFVLASLPSTLAAMLLGVALWRERLAGGAMGAGAGAAAGAGLCSGRAASAGRAGGDGAWRPASILSSPPPMPSSGARRSICCWAWALPPWRWRCSASVARLAAHPPPRRCRADGADQLPRHQPGLRAAVLRLGAGAVWRGQPHPGAAARLHCRSH